MAGFWDSELGVITGNAEDAFAKSFKQIPDNTLALARINSFSNAENNGATYLNIEWHLIEGDFQGQKVNQKIKAFDQDPKVKHRALNMLKLIYMMFKVSPKSSNPPSDDELGVFNGKVAGIRIRETEPNDQGKQYNWVSEVHNSQGFESETGVRVEVTHTRESTDTAFSRNRVSESDLNKMDDDIPF